MAHLCLVFQTLRTNKFLVKRSKCAFAQQLVKYLGHLISAAGMSMDSNKVAAMMDWPVPKNVK